MDKRFFSSSKFSIRIWGHLFTEYGVNIFSGLKWPGGNLTAYLRLVQTLRMGGAIPPFPHMASWHLIKVRGHRAFKIQNFYRVPCNCRQKYSKQFLSAGKEISFETICPRLWLGRVWCSVVFYRVDWQSCTVSEERTVPFRVQAVVEAVASELLVSTKRHSVTL